MACDMCKFKDGKCLAMRAGKKHCCTPHCKHSNPDGCHHPGGKPIMCELWFCPDALIASDITTSRTVSTKYILAQLALPDSVGGRPKYPYWYNNYRTIDDGHLLDWHISGRKRLGPSKLHRAFVGAITKWLRL